LIFAAVKKAEIERLRPLSNSDLPVMDLSLIQAATNNFSKENKLGEGGFGPVYRVRTSTAKSNQALLPAVSLSRRLNLE
jgi:hypothetical protein